jgi:hypothetical protein
MLIRTRHKKQKRLEWLQAGKKSTMQDCIFQSTYGKNSRCTPSQVKAADVQSNEAI